MEQKSPEMQKLLDSFSTQVFGRSRSSSINSRICVMCGNVVNDFPTPLYEREYQISGLCAACQDEVFGVED